MELPTSSSSLLFTPKLFLKTFHIPNSTLPISCPKLLSHSSRFKFYVHSKQPTKRPNYLRRKLIDPQKQVIHSPTFADCFVTTHHLVQESSNLDCDYGIDGVDMNKTDNLVRESRNLGFDYGIDGVDTSRNDNLVQQSRNLDFDYGIEGYAISRTDNLVEESSNLDLEYGIDGVDKSLIGKEKMLGDSELLNKLESWVQRCKADTEYWGFGTGHIFSVFQDSDGRVERVEVDEDEIWRRSATMAGAFKGDEGGKGSDVSSKILYAKELATEMEKGNSLIARDSPISRFVVSGSKSGYVDVFQDWTSSFVNAIQHTTQMSGFVPRMRRIGFMVMITLLLVRSLKKLFIGGEKGQGDLTKMEKEMLRRKLKARAKKEEIVNGRVEVIHKDVEVDNRHIVMPGLDREELMKDIIKAKGYNNELEHSKLLSNKNSTSDGFDNKIQEIKLMARHVREIEKRDDATSKTDGEDTQTVSFLDKNVVSQLNGNGHVVSMATFPNRNSGQIEIEDTPAIGMSSDNLVKNNEDLGSTSPVLTFNVDTSLEMCNKYQVHTTSTSLADKQLAKNELNLDKESPTKRMRVITSVEEAREYLSRKHVKQDACQENRPTSGKSVDVATTTSEIAAAEPMNQKFEKVVNHMDSSSTQPNSTDSSKYAIASSENSDARKPISIEDDNNCSQNGEGENMIDLVGHEHSSTRAGQSPSPRMDNWLEKNFHELEPVIKTMGEGFRRNYMVAKETTKQDINSEDSTLLLKSEGDSGELSWMKDEKLRDIVFRVRDNELAGREPFHKIDNESKLAFFNGLENKVEEENRKLLNLHKFLHLNIENLDYGTDCISLYDPLEKIIPRWKGPPISDFLSEIIEDRVSVVGEDIIIKKLAQNSSETPTDLPSHDTKSSVPSSFSDISSRVKMGIPKSSKIIIEGSDGSTKVGKKSGKEFWQHTKKWSQGFLSSYNEETDPEVKAVMKDIGKDLDRWITEDEIKEAGDLMDKLPEGNQKLIKSKVDKVKREMELFGPQAVVSKYREYADVEEEDYLWWLDLPYVLCIELYMKDDGEQKTGLYSLEMAPDLELDPKPSHVIAFEDAGDCKSLCYIIQHHLEVIGNGNAFVVARPPKDAFREAKENGFSLTVIRKGELQLNVDQPLEDVEELITEIGSKVYHDKIMKEHSVDMSGIMKGLYRVTKPSRRRRSKRMLKKPTRH